MNNRVTGLLLIAILFFSIVVSSCKKEEETSPSMTGTFSFELPRYAFRNDEFQLSVPEVTDPTEGVEYFWTFGWRSDTVFGRDLTLVVPDSLGDFTLRAWAKKEGYQYRIAGPYVTTTVDPGFNGSIQGRTEGEAIFIDPRDNKEYHYATIGNLQWFVQNLDWDGSGEAYMKLEPLASVFGRLYSWNDATGGVSASGLAAGPQGVCPPGWSIPTNEDWEDLAKVLNDGEELPFKNKWKGLGDKLTVRATFNKESHLWTFSPDNQMKNSVGWNAVPAGNSTVNYTMFKGLYEYAFFWTATEHDQESALYRFLYNENGDFSYNNVSKDNFGASVRCVRILD